jgi:hypothetical protein
LVCSLNFKIESQYTIPSCYGKLSNDKNVCSGNGNCISFDNCVCKKNYFDKNFNITIVFQFFQIIQMFVLEMEIAIVFENGYYDSIFKIPICKNGNDIDVCNGKGTL